MIVYLLLFLSISESKASQFIEELEILLSKDPEYREVKHKEEYNKILERSSRTKLFLPDISISHSRSKAESIGSTTEIESDLSKLNLRYSLFSFGSDYSSFQSSKYGYKSYKNDLDKTLIQEELKNARLLLNLIRYRKSYQIQKDIVELKTSSFKIAKNKFKQGTLSKNDLTRVNIDYINTKSEMISIKNELASIESQIYALKQNNLATLTEFPWMQLFKTKGISKVSSLKYDETQIPEIERLKNLVESYEYESDSVFKTHLGSFSFNYSRDLYKEEDNDDLYGYSASIVYTLPLFENFDTHKQVQLSRANLRTAKTIYRYNKNFYSTSFDKKKQNLIEGHEYFKDRINILNDSKSLYQNVLKRFKRGKISVNDLFIEQDRLLTTERLTNNAIYNIHLRYIEFIHASGLSVIQNRDLF